MNSNRTIKIGTFQISYPDLLLWVVSLVIFIYVLYRAHVLSMTHDESLSYKIFSGLRVNDWKDTSANHHILNTFLMWISSSIFGVSEWALRLPNVLSFIPYAIGVIFTLGMLKDKWIYILAIPLLLLNPFVLDFFSLARGYGISLGMLMMSLFFFFRFFLRDSEDRYNIYLALTMIFGALGMFANQALVNYFIVLLGLTQIRNFYKYKFSSQKISLRTWMTSVTIGLLGVIPLKIIVDRLLFLQEHNELYFGANSWSQTVFSLVAGTRYNYAFGTDDVAIATHVVMLVFFVGILVAAYLRKFDSVLTLIGMVLCFIIYGTMLEHDFFDSLYPMERTAVFLIPIFGLYFVFFIQELSMWRLKEKIIIQVFTVLFSLPLVGNFLVNMNTSYTNTWIYDAHTKDAILAIKEYQDHYESPILVTNTWLFEPSMNFYINSLDLNIVEVNRLGVDAGSDFVYAFRQDITDLQGYDTLEVYDDIDAVLLIKK